MAPHSSSPSLLVADDQPFDRAEVKRLVAGRHHIASSLDRSRMTPDPGFRWTTQVHPAHEQHRTTAWINDAFCDFVRHDRDTDGDVSAKLLEYVHPDDREAVALQWERARDNRSNYSGFVRYRRHDATFRWHFYRVDYVGKGTWSGMALDMHEAYMMRTFGALSPKVVHRIDMSLRIAVAGVALAIIILLINGWGIING